VTGYQLQSVLLVATIAVTVVLCAGASAWFERGRAEARSRAQVAEAAAQRAEADADRVEAELELARLRRGLPTAPAAEPVPASVVAADLEARRASPSEEDRP